MSPSASTSARIPLLEGALDCIRAGNIPGGLKNNRDFAECVVGYEEGISEELKTILFDPQTAGGLFIAVAPESTLSDLQAADTAVEIGEVLERTKPLIAIEPERPYLGKGTACVAQKQKRPT